MIISMFSSKALVSKRLAPGEYLSITPVASAETLTPALFCVL